MVATAPFFFDDVKATEYWRFTRDSAERLPGRDHVVIEATTRGGIGSVLRHGGTEHHVERSIRHRPRSSCRYHGIHPGPGVDVDAEPLGGSGAQPE